MINKINVKFGGDNYNIIVGDNSELSIKARYDYLTLEDLRLYKEILIKTKEDLEKLSNKNKTAYNTDYKK
jgi:hypothetical protein